jgi:hypothetical protein
MISLIVALIVLGLLFWLVSLIPLPAPFPMIIKVIFIIIAVVTVLNAFGLNINGTFPVLR